MIVEPYPEEVGLTAELGRFIDGQTSSEGPTPSAIWSGLTFYRFEQRVALYWSEVSSASLCMVVQGRKHVRIGPANYFYDPLHYLVIKRGMSFQAEILEASRERPFLSFVLQMQPDQVADVYNEMVHLTTDDVRIEPALPLPDIYVSALDSSLVGAVQRFLQALEVASDRKILAPMYLREIIYRLLRSEQHMWLLESAILEKQGNTISAAIAFMQQEMRRPLTVRSLADGVCMSESGFAHLFKSTTGISPLQFLKQLRLEHARTFLLSGGSVSEAAESVGYTSISHFICEFKRQYGESPRAYTKKVRSLHIASVRDVSIV